MVPDSQHRRPVVPHAPRRRSRDLLFLPAHIRCDEPGVLQYPGAADRWGPVPEARYQLVTGVLKNLGMTPVEAQKEAESAGAIR